MARSNAALRGSAWLALLALAACSGPFGPLAGGRLGGDVAPRPSDGWAFTADVKVVQLETRPDDPYSVNLGCVEHGGALYVGSPDPEDDGWVANVVADPRVRLRVAGTLYEMRAVRVEEEAEWALAGRALFEKYDLDVTPETSHGWLFRLEPR